MNSQRFKFCNKKFLIGGNGMEKYGLWIDGKEVFPENHQTEKVLNPYNSEAVFEVVMASKEDLEVVISSARRGYEETMKKMPAYERAQILKKASQLLEQQKEEFAKTICLEAGKP